MVERELYSEWVRLMLLRLTHQSINLHITKESESETVPLTLETGAKTQGQVPTDLFLEQV
jgi:hypothetical protein